MLEPFVIKGFADGTNAAVHHVAGADQIRTGLGLNHRLFAELLDRFVVEHNPVIADDPVVTVAGVGIQGDVGHDRHSRHRLFDLADGPGDQAIGVEAFGPILGFEALCHFGEQHDAADAQIPGPLHFTGEGLQAPAARPRHGTDRLNLDTLVDEEGVDEIRRREAVLANHGAQGRRATQAAGAVSELHQNRGPGGDRTAAASERR